MTYQAFDFQEKFTGDKKFDKKDASKYDRLRLMYNAIRHYKMDELPESNLHMIKLTNESIIVERNGKKREILYGEFYELLMEIGNISDQLSRAGK